jgi:hypothetical protein
MTISISGVLFLFGLTWLFFVLIISVPGLQGFFVFAFILFTEGFGYWKETFLSCYKPKLKPTQTSLQANVSWKNKSAGASTLSEAPHNISTTDHIHSEMNTKQPIQEMKVLEALHDQALVMDVDVLY